MKKFQQANRWNSRREKEEIRRRADLVQVEEFVRPPVLMKARK
jgi:hypothetical protein